MGVKWPERETGHSVLSSAEVKKERTYTSASTNCRYGVDWDILYLLSFRAQRSDHFVICPGGYVVAVMQALTLPCDRAGFKWNLRALLKQQEAHQVV